jgi:selenocysteine insertion sequence-binding protein 2
MRGGNPLDSSAPTIRRGKEREAPKKKRPSALRKVWKIHFCTLSQCAYSLTSQVITKEKEDRKQDSSRVSIVKETGQSETGQHGDAEDAVQLACTHESEHIEQVIPSALVESIVTAAIEQPATAKLSYEQVIQTILEQQVVSPTTPSRRITSPRSLHNRKFRE